MSKVNLPPIQGGFASVQGINERLQQIEDAFDNTLSRDGSVPNSMDADLDMDGNDILNVGLISADDLNVQGLTVTGILTQASAEADRAEQEADRSEVAADAATVAANSITGFYNTLAELQAETDIIVGDIVQTNGYYTAGDGGGNLYEIVSAGTGTDDGGSFIDLSGSGLQAKGLFGATVSVKQCGAVGDGVTDDTAAIQAALDHAVAIGGASVMGVNGQPFKITNSLNIGANTRLHDIEIVSELAPTIAALRAVNTLPSGVSLTANASYNATTVQVSSTSGFTVGAAALLASTAQWSTDGLDSFTQGEVVFVRSVVDATTLELSTPVDSEYLVSDTATLTLIPTTRRGVTIQNVKLRGQGVGFGQVGIGASNVIDFSVIDCDVSGFDNSSIQINGVVNALIRGNRLSDALLAGNGYNVVMSNACRNVRIVDNTMLNSRASYANGGNAGCSRDVVIANNNIAGFYTAGLGLKGNVSSIVIEGNTLYGDGSSIGLADGIRARGRDMVVIGNVIKGCKRFSILCYPNGNNPAQTNKIVISDNIIESAQSIGINFQDEYSGTTSGVQISGNVLSFENVTSVSQGGIHIRANDKALSNLSVFGNVIRNCPFNGIDVRTTGTGTIDNYLQYGNVITFSATGIAGGRRKSVVSGTFTNTSVGDGDGQFLYDPIAHTWTVRSERTNRWVFANTSVHPVQNNTRSLGLSTNRWADTFSTNLRPGTGTVIWTSGSNSPEGVVTAPVGSLFTSTDGGAATTLYVKESGTGNTGWAAK